MNRSNDIKPSFGIKYALLIILTAVISTTVGYFVNSYFSKENKMLIVSQLLSANKVTDETSRNDPIEIKYTLRSNPNSEIKSYFLLTIYLRNSSNHAIEDFDLFVSSDDSTIRFIENPIIKTIPKEILSGMNVQMKESLHNKHRWKIDLLNKQETLSFDYSLYSEDYIQNLNVNVVPRKKDWTVKYEDISIISDDSKLSAFDLIIAPLLAFILLVLITFPLVILKYRRRWNSVQDLRDQYQNQFWKYFIHN